MNPYDRPTDPQPITRRTVIAQAGVAAAALAGLSACSNYAGGAAPSTAAAPSSEAAPGSGASGSGGTPASGGGGIATADIPVGSGKIFADQQVVVTQPKKGQFKAFTSICTHQGCPVAEVTDTINCNCHGSKFSITDGSVVNPPATQPLAAKSVKVSGSSLTVS